MDNDEANVVSAPRKPRKLPTAAARLLAAATGTGAVDLVYLAQRLKIPVDTLQACRDGSAALRPEVQIVLAALIVELSPPHASLARRLYAQAQSALRLQTGVVDSHLTYPAWRRRLDGY